MDSMSQALVFSNWDEANPVALQTNLTECHETTFLGWRNVRGCTSDMTTGVCVNGTFDWEIFDPDLRPDCNAFMVRNDMVVGGREALSEWIKSCDPLERMLKYSDNCPGNAVVRRTSNTLTSRSATDPSYHWHYHGVRGLLYDPLVGVNGAYGCQSGTCTTSGALSCWPHPRFRPGQGIVNFGTRVYSCGSTNPTNHIVGYVSGYYGGAGTAYRTDPSNECGVSLSPEGTTVRIACPNMRYSGVTITNLGSSQTITEHPDLRNVCD